MDASERKDSDQHLEAPHNGIEEEELLSSGRQRKPTERMREYKKKGALKKERRVIRLRTMEGPSSQHKTGAIIRC